MCCTFGLKNIIEDYIRRNKNVKIKCCIKTVRGISLSTLEHPVVRRFFKIWNQILSKKHSLSQKNEQKHCLSQKMSKTNFHEVKTCIYSSYNCEALFQKKIKVNFFCYCKKTNFELLNSFFWMTVILGEVFWSCFKNTLEWNSVVLFNNQLFFLWFILTLRKIFEAPTWKFSLALFVFRKCQIWYAIISFNHICIHIT